jgi:hypothetical protein
MRPARPGHGWRWAGNGGCGCSVRKTDPALNSEFPDRRTRRPAWAIGMRSIGPVSTNSRAVRGAHVRRVQSSVMQTNFDVNDRHIVPTLRCRRRLVIVVPSCRPVTGPTYCIGTTFLTVISATFVPYVAGRASISARGPRRIHRATIDQPLRGGRP